MNESVPSRLGATRLRALCLRVGAVVTALLTMGAVALPALATAHVRRSPGVGRAARLRHPAARRDASHRRAGSAIRPVPARDTSLVVRSWSERAPRSCHGEHTRIGRVGARSTDRVVVCLLNRARMRRDLPPLRLNRRLDRSAQGWTNTMVRDHSFSHGSDFGSRISAAGFDWSQIGENIADGYRTPLGAVRAWMRSTGHCQNILDPDFREVGAGFARASAIHHVRRGTWTLDLGLLMHQRSQSNDWTPAEHCPY